MNEPKRTKCTHQTLDATLFNLVAVVVLPGCLHNPLDNTLDRLLCLYEKLFSFDRWHFL